MRNYAAKVPGHVPPIGSLPGFMYNWYRANTCDYFSKWEDLTKDNSFFFWLHWVFIAACGLSLVAAAGATLRYVVWFLVAVASLVAEQGLSVCGLQ